MLKSRRRSFAVFAVAAVLIIVFAVSGCKKKEYFPEPELILNKWSKATLDLDYETYKKCEAYPREKGVFNEMYRYFYFTDITIINIEKLDEKDIRTDFEGNRFHKRNVVFECAEVSRSGKVKVKQVKGEVFFVKFLDGDRVKDGWLMANRTIIRF